MSLRLLRFADYHTMPWRNGGGITHEIARDVSAGTADFGWRISMAEVGAGRPFSPFPGVDRTILLLDGPEMTLTVDGVAHRLGPHEPFAFDGGSATDCQIPSPTRDLNVMTRRGLASASVQVLGPDGPTRINGATPLVLVALDGPARVDTPDSDGAGLEPLDTALWDSAGPVTVRSDGALAVVRVGPAGRSA